MHELTATERILEVVLDHVPDGDGRVADVWLERGALSGLSEEAIRFHWELLVPGTRADGASLHVETIGGVVACRACGATGPALDDMAACASCGSASVQVLAGGACHLRAIDVREEPTWHSRS